MRHHPSWMVAPAFRSEARRLALVDAFSGLSSAATLAVFEGYKGSARLYAANARRLLHTFGVRTERRRRATVGRPGLDQGSNA